MIKYFKIVNLLYSNYLTTFNFFCTTYIIFILLFSGYVSLAAEAFLTLSIIQFFTLGASSNLRNIYIANKNIISFKEIMSLRLLVGIISFLISSLLIFNFISKINLSFHISILLLSIFSWIIEIILAKEQLEKKTNRLFLYNSICFTLTIPLIINLFSINSLIILILIYIFLNIIIFKKKIYQQPYLIISHFKSNIKKFKLGITSTFIKYLSNLIWRSLAFILIGDYKAGLLFVAFSIGSFLGTLFDISYGAFFSKSDNGNKKKLLNYFTLIYILIVILLLYISYYHSKLSKNDLQYIISAFVPSVIGGIFLLNTLIIRQKLFEKEIFYQKCFLIDMVGYLIVILSIPLFFYIKESYVVYAFFFSSSLTYLIYTLFNNVIIKKYKL